MHLHFRSPSRTTFAAAIVTACGLASTRVLVAQSAASHDSLPVELVRALLQPFGGPSSQEFFVGKVPTSLAPFLYVPKNARVIGGMSSGNGTTAVLELPPGSEDVVTSYQREMPKLGWTLPSATAGRSWGFVPAAAMTMNGNGLEFCHIGQSAQIFPSPDGAGGTRVTITVNMYGGRCAGDRVTFVAAQPPEAVPLPVLLNPAGSFMNAQACSASFPFSGRSNGTAERVQTAMSPNQLLDFFSKQLADSGWTSPQSVAIARRSWTHADSANSARELTVSANPIAGTPCLDVSMQVRTLPPSVIRR